jgi:hypothetical protein
VAARKDAAKQTGGGLLQLPVRLASGHKKVQLHDGDVDVGHTFRAPILKLGVSYRAVICASADIKNFSVRE